MQLKESAYNYIYDDLGKDQIVFYNSRTGALAVVHEAEYEQFKTFQETGKEIENTEFLNNLLKCGYLLPAGVDEKFLITTNMMFGRYNKNTLSLTIAPTMACNFRCIYCFEQGHYGNSMMDEKTQENLLKFIKAKLNSVKSVHVTWFGGEPLLGMPIIESLSQHIIALCEEKEISYKASIITNGYLLTKEVAEKLKLYKVYQAQITVDGSREIHDARRPMANGEKTYDVIMKNLQTVKGVIPIGLRINVNHSNMDAANRVIDDLKDKDLLEYVHPNLGLVIPYYDVYDKSVCLSNEIYAKYNLNFIVNNNISLHSIYPKPKSHYCIADGSSGWVIDDKGFIYKCWNDIGNQERSIGNINSNTNQLQNTDFIQKYFSFDPMSNSQCKDCKLLPVCMGSCPHDRTENRFSCDQRKYYLHDYLLIYAKQLIQAKVNT